MKNALFVLVCLVFTSCAPKLYELGDGKMVTEKKFIRITNRNDRQLSNPKYMARYEKRMDRKIKRYNKNFDWGNVNEFFGPIKSIDIVYDTIGSEH